VTKPVAVLGCGPAGLMAVHACKMAGLEVVSLSQYGKSKLGGAQFLHKEIPGITEAPEGKVTYRVVGNAVTYQRKTYGVSGPQPSFVSFSNVNDGDVIDAWSLPRAYDKLWDGYHQFINDARVDGQWVVDHADEFSLVISTIPRTALCLNRRVMPVPDGSEPVSAHTFHYKSIRILNDRCFVPEGVMRHFGENVVHYNGLNSNSWYRSSDLWGVKSTEFGANVEGMWLPYGDDLVEARKPLSTSCDCHKDLNVLFVGRYGAWDKSRLAHDGFYTTMERVLS